MEDNNKYFYKIYNDKKTFINFDFNINTIP
jgi:hypothetical protein